MMFPTRETQSATTTPCSGPSEGMYSVGIVLIRLKLSGQVVGEVG
jgi:hypothetical protein